MRKRTLIALLAWACTVSGCSHTHTHPEEEAEEAIAVTVWTDRFELFMEYPPLRPGVPARFAAHLTNLADYRPVTAGPVRFEFRRQGRVVETAVVDQPLRPGIFVPEVAFPEPGELTLNVMVESATPPGVIEAPPLRVYDADAAAPAPPEVEVRGDSIGYLKEQQWKLPFRTEPARTQRLRPSLTVSGEVEADPARDSSVVPPLAGRFGTAPGGLPRLGARVRRGELLGWVEPPLHAPDQAALDNARLQSGISRAQLEQDLAESRAVLARRRSEAELARQERDRAARLLQVEAVPERAVLLARERAAVAEANLEAARQTLASLEAAQARLERDTAGSEPPRLRLPLRAPGGGTLVETAATPGAYVSADRTLFRIVDLSRVRVRAHLHESRSPAAGAPTRAAVRLPGGEAIETGARGSRLLLIGEVVDQRTRTLPVVWAVDNPDRRLKIGMRVELDLFLGQEVDTLAVPSTAVFEEDNKKVVYVHAAGETFDRRIVRTGVEDRGYVQILEGLSVGERVVVEGGYEVALAARSTEGAAAGHVH